MDVAIVFPGQGSQTVGMMDTWLEHPAAKAVIDEATAVLGTDISELCRDEEALARTDVTQQAVLTADVAAFRVLQAEGIEPMAVAGHSLGEFAALVAAGAADFGPILEVVRERSLAMAAAGEARPGTMLAIVGLPIEGVIELCADARGDDILVVANENSALQTVLAGELAPIERAEALAKERKARAIRPNVAGAFHSPLMEPAKQRIDAALDGITFRAPGTPIVQNVTAEATTDPDVIMTNMRAHVISGVKWVATGQTIAGLGATAVVEAGPGDVLTRMAKRDLKELTVVAARSPEEVAAAAATVRS